MLYGAGNETRTRATGLEGRGSSQLSYTRTKFIMNF